MPLKTPFAYIVSYDLKQAESYYTPLYQELQRSDKWCHYLPALWIVLRKDALVELRPKLTSLIFQGDALLIMPAKGPADGWMTKEAWDWINANVPKEW